MLRFLAIAAAFLGLSTGASAVPPAIFSPDGERVVWLIPSGKPMVLLTQIWMGRADGTMPIRTGIYLGPPGDVGFLPGGGLVYLERALDHVAFGTTPLGRLTSDSRRQRRLPLARNRIWRIDASGESRWPLPGEMDPIDLAVAPDGSRLAVTDREGLWLVDAFGRARLLVRGHVRGPLEWSQGADAVAAVVEGESSYVGMDGAEVPAWSSSSNEGGAKPPKPAEENEIDAAMLMVHQALNWWVRGHHAMHRGEYRSARDAYRESVSGFKEIRKTYTPLGLSRGSCQGYIDAIRRRIRNDEALKEAVCSERLLVVGDLISEFNSARANETKAGLGGLLSWASAELKERRLDPSSRARDLAQLRHLFQCPATDEPHMPEIGYFFRPAVHAAGPVLTCYWHRGRVQYLLGSPGGFAVEAQNIPRARVDSLFDLGVARLNRNEVDQAIFPLRVVAHQRPRNKDAHLKLGYAFLEDKYYRGAKWAFRKAAALPGNDPEPYYGLGLVLMELHNERYQAITYFRKALMRDRDFVDAQYKIALVRYMLNEHDVKPELDRVLKTDPEYADAYLLMGDWYANFMEDYEEAIVWYTRYLAMRPADQKVGRRLGHAYLRVKDYDRILEKVQVFTDEYPDAIELMPIVAQACAKRNKYDMAMGFFSTYISRLKQDQRALYDDIGLIASPEEIAEYEQTSGELRTAFLERFWNVRDPDIGTSVNERLLEHYRRVWYASLEFSDGKQPWDRRGEVYIRFGDPDHVTSSRNVNFRHPLPVLRVKERLARQLYGAEAIGASFMGPVFPLRNFALERDILGFESAAADLGIEGERDAFTGGDPDGSDSNLRQMTTSEGSRDGGSSSDRNDTERSSTAGTIGAAGDIGQSELASTVTGPLPSRINTEVFAGSGFSPVLSAGADHGSTPWESWIYLNIDGGIEITFTDEFNSQVFDFAPVPDAPDLGIEQVTKFRRFSPAMVFKQAVALTPDTFTPEYAEAPFDFYYTLADFKGPDGNSALEIYYGIPCASTNYLPEHNVTQVAVRRQLALLSPNSDRVYRKTAEMFYKQPGNRTGPDVVLPDVVRLDVPPGVYRLEVKARDRMTGRLGIYRQQVVVESYHREGLRVSDLELAYSVSDAAADPGKFGKNGLNVVPMPSRTFGTGQNVFVYYEIYNLKRDEFGQTQYRVEYTMGPKAGGVLSRLAQTLTGKSKKQGVAIGYEQLGVQESEVAYTELELGEARSGRHYLNVKVTDLNSGRSFEKETTFVVQK
ncbi:MAG: GWxTD domain-containing protein [Gemmatimonadota bacterium]|nr:GWxTD domain-containing protein [Gemmatimonadota bacterium]